MSHSTHEHENPKPHGFIILGTKKLFLCHLPMYGMPEHRYQVILEVEFQEPANTKYLETRKENPNSPIIILSKSPMILKNLVNSNSFVGTIHFANEHGDPEENGFITSATTDIKKIHVFEHLHLDNVDYPENLEYYLFGTDSDWHLSHLLTKSPNFEQEINIGIPDKNIQNELQSLDSVVRISIPSINEKNLQPITKDPLTMKKCDIKTHNRIFSINIINKFWINNSFLNHM